MNIDQETSPSGGIVNGHTVVGPVAVPLTSYNRTMCRGVIVRAAGAGEDTPNTDIVYVGRACVTADNDVHKGGVPLLPGGSIFLPVDDASQIFVISNTEAQDVSWLGV